MLLHLSAVARFLFILLIFKAVLSRPASTVLLSRGLCLLWMRAATCASHRPTDGAPPLYAKGTRFDSWQEVTWWEFFFLPLSCHSQDRSWHRQLLHFPSLFQTGSRDIAFSTRALCPGDPGFETQSGKPILSVFLVFLSSCTQIFG